MKIRTDNGSIHSWQFWVVIIFAAVVGGLIIGILNHYWG